MLADPNWVKNAWECRAEDTAPCLRCLNCYGEVTPPLPGRRGFQYCSVNPRVHREDIVPRRLEKAEKQKKVVVIGGGPAGMKASLTARERGHEVILFEKNASLGGQTRCADYDSYKADLKRYRDYLICQLHKSAVDIRLSTEATPEMVAAENPDSLVLALGSVPFIPKIPGLDEVNFLASADAYPKIGDTGKRVFIIGGGSIGCELALLLGELGREVVVAEIGPQLCTNLNEYFREGLFEKLNGCSKVRFHTSCKVTRVDKNSVDLVLQDGSSLEPAMDTIIVAAGLKTPRDRVNSFYGIVQDTNSIGDCNSPGTVLEAVEDAYFICAAL
ncbi:MAG: FAD-dependent oxidoreductase [Treponema sp.]|jgi:NADPH-dependent 2,4-dienoyl-CoA reductase/sulfur reductase-like enzyme|nr:FAD-dependent oxidoreductase [Treponema sp.]